jgi:hypothetical protein
MDILKKWHVIVVDKCYMCKRNVESVALLVHCDVAYVIWIAFFSRFELSWIMPRRVVDLYACWWTTGNTQNVVCERWCLRTFYGVYGGKRMTEVLRTGRRH